MINYLVNKAKVGVVKLADLYNEQTSPFDEYTRPFMPCSQMTLEQKEALFFNDLFNNFRALDDGKTVIWNYKKTRDGSLDLGDQALWHGVTTYMLCMKYRHSPSYSLAQLITASANGMVLHQRTNWESRPRLVRGVRDILGREFQDEVSNDTLTGHVLGIYGLLNSGIPDAQVTGTWLARSIADSLIDNNMCLTNANGSVTRFGKLVNGYLTDGLNLSICLATLKLASKTWNCLLPAYEAPYQKLVKTYKDIIPYAHVTLGSWRHDYDAHRAAISYMILADLEKDHEITRLYALGALRSWKRERKSRNPWIYYLMRRVMLMDPNDAQGCIQRLAEMSVSNKTIVEERINSKDEAFWKDQGIRFFKYGKKLQSSQPLPLWKVGSQDFFWQRSQYNVDTWVGNQTGEIEHNGVDFLAAYWGFKELRLL